MRLCICALCFEHIYSAMYSAAPAIPASAMSTAPRGALLAVTWTGPDEVVTEATLVGLVNADLTELNFGKTTLELVFLVMYAVKVCVLVPVEVEVLVTVYWLAPYAGADEADQEPSP